MHQYLDFCHHCKVITSGNIVTSGKGLCHSIGRYQKIFLQIAYLVVFNPNLKLALFSYWALF